MWRPELDVPQADRAVIADRGEQRRRPVAVDETDGTDGAVVAMRRPFHTFGGGDVLHGEDPIASTSHDPGGRVERSPTAASS
jgi:hypothetical protein